MAAGDGRPALSDVKYQELLQIYRFCMTKDFMLRTEDAENCQAHSNAPAGLPHAPRHWRRQLVCTYST